MKVVIRTDSSLLIGTGHLMRCLTLAEELRRNRVEVVFICRELPGNLIDLAEAKGYRVHRLPLENEKLMNDPRRDLYDRWRGVEKDFDGAQTEAVLAEKESDAAWLVVDHYGLDADWESPLRQYVGNIMVVDDLANRRHDCDMLLDQNFYENSETRYDGLTPDAADLLLGPQYVLLREEFRQVRPGLNRKYAEVKCILVSFGGADNGNDTLKALDMTASPEYENLIIDIVVGKTNPHAGAIKQVCDGRQNVNYYHNIDNMAQMMARADICIGAGGTSTWERCCLGLPAVTLSVADNQVEVARLSHKAGFAVYLGGNHEVDAAKIRQAVDELISNREKRREMSKIGLELVDGQGVEKVVNYILRSVSVKK